MGKRKSQATGSKLLILICTGLLAPAFLAAQSGVAEGTEFFVAFQKNFRDYDYDNSNKLIPSQPLELSLVITSRTQSKVAIEWPGHSETVVVVPGERTIIEVDSTLQLRSVEEADRRTVHVTSDQPITVTALSHRYQTTDSYTIFPVEGLGTRYRAVGYKWLADDLLSQFAIVATEDDTRVEIVPSVVTSTGQPAGTSFTVTLDRGEAYQVRPKFRPTSKSDLTGTLVTSSKPVALFSGHNCAYVPDQEYKACNILCEQLQPVDAWGREFVAAPFTPKRFSVVRIIPDEPGTEVRLNGAEPVTMEDGWLELTLFQEPLHIQASAPVQVAQYSPGYTARTRKSGPPDSLGDPMMVMLSPVENYGTNFMSLGPFEGEFMNYVAIVTSREGTKGLTIGGDPLDPELFHRVGGSDFWYACVEVLGGQQPIESKEPVGVISYGFGFGSKVYDAYGHVAPMWSAIESVNGAEGVELSDADDPVRDEPAGADDQDGATSVTPADRSWRPAENIE